MRSLSSPGVSPGNHRAGADAVRRAAIFRQCESSSPNLAREAALSGNNLRPEGQHVHGGLGIVPRRSDTPAMLDVTAESQPGRPRPSAAPRQGAHRPGPPLLVMPGSCHSPAYLLTLQRTVGNAAVTALQQHQSASVTVQRCGGIPCDCATDEEGGAQHSSADTSMPPPVQRVAAYRAGVSTAERTL